MTGKQHASEPASAVPRGPNLSRGLASGTGLGSLSQPACCRRSREQMIRAVARPAVSPLVVCLTLVVSVQAQSPETPMTRLQPIDAPSAVDRYVRPPGSHGRTDPDSPVVTAPVVTAPAVTAQWESNAASATEAAYTVRAQFQLPGNTPPPVAPSDATLMPPPSLGTTQPPTTGTVLGPTTQPPTTGTVLGPTTQTVMPPGPPFSAPAPGTMSPTMPVAPPTAPPRGLPMGAATSSSDLSPMGQPQLNDQFATIDNCSCVSPPSGYVAATGWNQCAPTTSYAVTPTTPPYLAPAAPPTVPAPVAGAPVIPDASTMPKGSGVPRHSLISLGQDRNPIVVGQGIIGQPVAYVPGQPVRNWFRWLFP